MKIPSSKSLMIFSILLIIVLKGKDNEYNDECARRFESFYNWEIFLPVLFVLLFFSLVSIIDIIKKKELKKELVSILFLGTPSIFLLIFIVKSILNLGYIIK